MSPYAHNPIVGTPDFSEMEWEMVAEEADTGNINLDNVPSAYGGSSDDYPVSGGGVNPPFAHNPIVGTPDFSFMTWEMIAEETAEGNVYIDNISNAYGGMAERVSGYDWSLVLPWNWMRKVEEHLEEEEKAKVQGSLPIAASGLIQGGMTAVGDRAADVSKTVKAADRARIDGAPNLGLFPNNPFSFLESDMGMVALGFAGVVLLVLLVK